MNKYQQPNQDNNRQDCENSQQPNRFDSSQHAVGDQEIAGINWQQPHPANINEQHQRRPGQSKGQLWKYALTVLVTVLLTFTITAGSGVLVLMAMQPSLAVPSSGQDSDTGLGFDFTDNQENREALAKLQAIYDAIQSDYYAALSEKELIEAMARGLVNEMDSPYTMYLTSDQVQRIDDSMSGEYSGIGAYVTLNPDGIVMITDVIENSPAEEAGLMVGDLFMEVDGEDVSGYGDVNAVAALVRGLEGTSVELVLYRPSEQDYVTLDVDRRVISTESVVHKMLTPAIGYIHIREFSQQSGQKFIAAMNDLQTQGAIEIIFDLRNNTGGLAHEVIQMLDYLLPEAVIATLKGRRDGVEFSESWKSDDRVGVSGDMRYAILVNEISASASELFAGCLRDYDKARLIGEQTMGKGSGTITIRLEDGSAINLTNFLYYLPEGESIEGVGIEPHEFVTLPEEAAGLTITRIPLELDSQLQAAMTYLNENQDE